MVVVVNEFGADEVGVEVLVLVAGKRKYQRLIQLNFNYNNVVSFFFRTQCFSCGNSLEMHHR